MQYAELLARLLPARRFGMVFGLDRIRTLLDALGAPDTRMGTIVHVGGTNGKGSTVAMIAALARAAGKRVATYTSPHLSSLRERITFDGIPITEAALCAAADRVYAHGADELTFFEQITAIACVAIADANVDITILEVGLGGRLDATNAVAAPIAVITSIAKDHEAILGETLDAIAAEKAGIFKPDQRVVVGAGPMQRVLVGLAHAAGVAVVTQVTSIEHVPPVALPGAHQRWNAACALAAIDHLEALGVIHVDEATRVRALATVTHPGRYEVIEGSPRVILDGAHNPDGARALAATLVARNERPVLVFAASADKDVRAMLEPLVPHVSAIIATRYQQERAMDPETLAATASTLTALPITIAPNLIEADRQARAHHLTILVAGSLFLVGEARVLYLHAPADSIVVSEPPPSSVR
jgi:dihydrofolate synthase/folylpolyglutamate synthase